MTLFLQIKGQAWRTLRAELGVFDFSYQTPSIWDLDHEIIILSFSTKIL